MCLQDQTTVVVKLYRHLPFPYLQVHCMLYALWMFDTHWWLVDILSANQECCLVHLLGNRVQKPSWDWIQVFFFSSYCPQAPPTLFSRWTRICGCIPLYKSQTKNTHKKKKTVKGELNVFSRELIELLITEKAIAYKSCSCDKIESSCMNDLHKV